MRALPSGTCLLGLFQVDLPFNCMMQEKNSQQMVLQINLFSVHLAQVWYSLPAMENFTKTLCFTKTKYLTTTINFLWEINGRENVNNYPLSYTTSECLLSGGFIFVNQPTSSKIVFLRFFLFISLLQLITLYVCIF